MSPPFLIRKNLTGCSIEAVSISYSRLPNTTYNTCWAVIATFSSHTLTRLAPVVTCPSWAMSRGRPERAFYVGAGNEAWGLEVFPVWTPNTVTRSWTSVDSAAAAVEFIRKAGLHLWPRRTRALVFPGRRHGCAPTSELPNTDVRGGPANSRGAARSKDQTGARISQNRSCSHC